MSEHRAIGEGILIDENGDTVCEGTFVNNWIIYNGKHSNLEKLGRCIFFKGSLYEGEIKDQVPNGQGIVYNKDATKYEGEFKDGFPNGWGVKTW